MLNRVDKSSNSPLCFVHCAGGKEEGGKGLDLICTRAGVESEGIKGLSDV